MNLEKLLNDFYKPENLDKDMRLAYYTEQWGGIVLLLRHDADDTVRVSGTSLEIFFRDAGKYEIDEDLYGHMPREVFLSIMEQFDDKEILSYHFL